MQKIGRQKEASFLTHCFRFFDNLSLGNVTAVPRQKKIHPLAGDHRILSSGRVCRAAARVGMEQIPATRTPVLQQAPHRWWAYPKQANVRLFPGAVHPGRLYRFHVMSSHSGHSGVAGPETVHDVGTLLNEFGDPASSEFMSLD